MVTTIDDLARNFYPDRGEVLVLEPPLHKPAHQARFSNPEISQQAHFGLDDLHNLAAILIGLRPKYFI